MRRLGAAAVAAGVVTGLMAAVWRPQTAYAAGVFMWLWAALTVAAEMITTAAGDDR